MKTWLLFLLFLAIPAEAQSQSRIPAEGRPLSERPWAFDHFFVWHDGGGWHLRMTTSGRSHNFSGWVDSPSGLGAVNAVLSGTPLSVNGRQVQFNIGVQGGENGFDWQQQSPCASFSLLLDGSQTTDLIDIGQGSAHPSGMAPFESCASGALPGQSGSIGIGEPTAPITVVPDGRGSMSNEPMDALAIGDPSQPEVSNCKAAGSPNQLYSGIGRPPTGAVRVGGRWYLLGLHGHPDHQDHLALLHYRGPPEIGIAHV